MGVRREGKKAGRGQGNGLEGDGGLGEVGSGRDGGLGKWEVGPGVAAKEKTSWGRRAGRRWCGESDVEAAGEAGVARSPTWGRPGTAVDRKSVV